MAYKKQYLPLHLKSWNPCAKVRETALREQTWGRKPVIKSLKQVALAKAQCYWHSVINVVCNGKVSKEKFITDKWRCIWNESLVGPCSAKELCLAWKHS